MKSGQLTVQFHQLQAFVIQVLVEVWMCTLTLKVRLSCYIHYKIKFKGKYFDGIQEFNL